MTNAAWFTLWGGLYILCAGLGFIPAPEGALGGMLTALSICFFIPPAALLYRAKNKRDLHICQIIRNLSAASLGLTVLVLTANFLALMAPEAVGNLLYVLLLFVSNPMICSQYWLLSLFLWACLLMVSLKMLKKRKKEK